MHKRLYAVLAVVMMASLVLAGCATPTAAPTEAPVVPTAAPVLPTAVPPPAVPRAAAAIIMPGAGPVGAGSLAVFEERGTGLLIGVDTDWSAFYPDQADFVLATAMKRMDLFVFATVKAGVDGTFTGGNFTGTLENGRVSMDVGSAWIAKVPAALMAEIEALKAKIISGEVSAKFPRAS